MASKKFPKMAYFWMDINEYDALNEFLSVDGRMIGPFLRSAVRKELIRDEIEREVNQIIPAGRNTKRKQQVGIGLSDSDYSALKKCLLNSKVPVSIFCRHLLKKELCRIEIEKEKNQTWDLE